MYGVPLNRHPIMGRSTEEHIFLRPCTTSLTIRRFIWRVFALLCTLIVTAALLVPADFPRLLGSSSLALNLDEGGIPFTNVEGANTASTQWPRKIWQTGSEAMTKKWRTEVQTWIDLNPEWKYDFLSDEGSSQYVNERFHNHTTIHNFWHDLKVTILRADLIRYLAMLADGGVYSDMDTSCMKPIKDWIPAQFSESEVAVVAGIEYDDNTYPMFTRPISLCQWTLMAKPGHAAFEKVVARVIYHLEYLARIKRVELNGLSLDKKEVLDATGPGAFTDSIMEAISETEGRKVSWEELSGLKQPKLYGDILILPINAFAGNQKHSHSGKPEFGPKLVKHHFGRSWYTKQEERPKAVNSGTPRMKTVT